MFPLFTIFLTTSRLRICFIIALCLLPLYLPRILLFLNPILLLTLPTFYLLTLYDLLSRSLRPLFVFHLALAHVWITVISSNEHRHVSCTNQGLTASWTSTISLLPPNLFRKLRVHRRSCRNSHRRLTIHFIIILPYHRIGYHRRPTHLPITHIPCTTLHIRFTRTLNHDSNHHVQRLRNLKSSIPLSMRLSSPRLKMPTP